MNNLYKMNAIEVHRKVVTYLVEADSPEEALEKANKRDIFDLEESNMTDEDEVESFKIVT